MRSRAKHRFRIAKVAGKDWVIVEVPSKEFVPSFEDIFRILWAIIHCENQKYPALPWRPSKMVRESLNRGLDLIDALSASRKPTNAEYEEAWAQLAKEFKLEHRG